MNQIQVQSYMMFITLFDLMTGSKKLKPVFVSINAVHKTDLSIRVLIRYREMGALATDAVSSYP